MCAKIDVLRRQVAELLEQLLTIFHVGVVRLVRPKEAPDWLQLANWFCGIHPDRDWKFAVGRNGSSLSTDRLRANQKRNISERPKEEHGFHWGQIVAT